ncbi:MAG: LLM class flavin-dependent oxidoreductase [Deltaproteobacteria bacterium]|nr:LLM class flavin-dependent oxidoreductase [Deltaproteobacteria bacterium]MBW2359648.1 LLM class flavin-dependent oxidoreductase [Deltaproteobacteria bacterium]
MKLGLAVEYSGRHFDLPIERIQRCEALGYDSVWTAEAYGSDAITPLAYIAAHTERIRLGTGVIQVAARTPTMTAMQLGTVDAMAGGGRVIGGLGASGPQIVEGWYGVPWGDPKERLRDTTLIMKKIFAREGPVTHDGKELQLPYRGPDSSQMGKPLKSILHYERAPKIWLGTGARPLVSMTAEIADGWLPFGLRKRNAEQCMSWLDEGFRRAGGGKSLRDFEIQGGVSVEITDDVKSALAAGKPWIALYVGGMGHPKLNFHRKRMHREGWGEAADRIFELFQAGKRDEAIAAVPDEYVDEGGLFGTPERIKERWRSDWESMPYTGVTVRARQEEAYELMADLVGSRDA